MYFKITTEVQFTNRKKIWQTFIIYGEKISSENITKNLKYWRNYQNKLSVKEKKMYNTVHSKEYSTSLT